MQYRGGQLACVGGPLVEYVSYTHITIGNSIGSRGEGPHYQPIRQAAKWSATSISPPDSWHGSAILCEYGDAHLAWVRSLLMDSIT